MIEEFYCVVAYIGDYKNIEQECESYQACVDFITMMAEAVLDDCGKEEYNMTARNDRNFVYWNIEKRFRLKEVK